MAVLDGYGRFLRVWKRMRWEKLAEEEFFAKNILRCVLRGPGHIRLPPAGEKGQNGPNVV